MIFIDSNVAVTQRHGISLVLTFDKAFSDIPGIERIS